MLCSWPLKNGISQEAGKVMLFVYVITVAILEFFCKIEKGNIYTEAYLFQLYKMHEKFCRELIRNPIPYVPKNMP